MQTGGSRVILWGEPVGPSDGVETREVFQMSEGPEMSPEAKDGSPLRLCSAGIGPTALL